MSKLLKGTFLTHAVVCLVLGAACLLAPGRVLGWLGFPGLDAMANFFARLLGAALLAMAWTSYRGWQATEWPRVAAVVEGELVFALLGCAGLLRIGSKGHWPWLLWVSLAILAAFAMLWLAAYLTRARAKR